MSGKYFEELARAFFLLRMNFQPTFCLDVSAHIETKMAAIRAYDSQLVANPGASAVPDPR